MFYYPRSNARDEQIGKLRVENERVCKKGVDVKPPCHVRAPIKHAEVVLHPLTTRVRMCKSGEQLYKALMSVIAPLLARDDLSKLCAKTAT